MTQSTILKLEFPDDFPVADWDAFHGLIERAETTSGSDCFTAAGWRAFAHRMLGVDYEARLLADSFAENPNGPQPQERFRQEHALFSFYVCGLGAIDCFCLASIGFGYLLRPLLFPHGKPLRVSPECVRDMFRKRWPLAEITASLDELLSGQEYETWKEVRDTLAHRYSPPRIIHVGNRPTTPPTEWFLGVLVDETDLIARRNWLFSTMAGLIADVRKFV